MRVAKRKGEGGVGERPGGIPTGMLQLKASFDGFHADRPHPAFVELLGLLNPER